MRHKVEAYGHTQSREHGCGRFLKKEMVCRGKETLHSLALLLILFVNFFLQLDCKLLDHIDYIKQAFCILHNIHSFIHSFFGLFIYLFIHLFNIVLVNSLHVSCIRLDLGDTREKDHIPQ